MTAWLITMRWRRLAVCGVIRAEGSNGGPVGEATP